MTVLMEFTVKSTADERFDGVIKVKVAEVLAEFPEVEQVYEEGGSGFSEDPDIFVADNIFGVTLPDLTAASHVMDALQRATGRPVFAEERSA